MITTKPEDIRTVGTEEILLSWSDGHRSLYSLKELRFQCPCAHCVDEWTGERVVRRSDVPNDLALLRWSPVGKYGVRFVWSDHHDTGIFSFEMLRRLCPCKVCLPVH